MRERARYLDVARGIGMMLIIVAHSCGLSSYLIYYFVQLFFLLSGCVYHSGRGYGENVARKARRLLVPYFASSAVLLAFYALTGRSWEETRFSAFGALYSRYCLYDPSRTADADNVFFLDVANGALWYLTAFFTASLVFHLVADRCLASWRFTAVCVLALAAATMLLDALPILLPWSLDLAFAGAAFMIAGAWMAKAGFFERAPRIWVVAAVLAAYVVCTAVNPGLNTSAREYGAYGCWSVPLFLIIGVTGSILCVWVARVAEGTLFGGALAYIGRHTVILLCFHVLGLTIAESVAGRVIDVHALRGTGFALYHTARIMASIGGCLVLGKMIDAAGRLFTRWVARS